jgi:hypothetical protein
MPHMKLEAILTYRPSYNSRYVPTLRNVRRKSNQHKIYLARNEKS